ncbi:single-stranded DNA-binding protein [Nocardioides nanhaiensis]|uniref:Single-stranded DNA-binding protein n=1 Tax=Nocardioides nanhaiensis TaxID=1476871 RepID=A0ABP8WPA3_9ACTN
MSAGRPASAGDVHEESDEQTNEVLLRGRVSAPPEQRELPSGDVVWTCRVVVRRPAPTTAESATARAAGRRPVTVDALDCAAWSARARRSVGSWREGDLVEVSGRLRRRFYRAGGGPVSRVEVEVVRARLIRRPTGG